VKNLLICFENIEGCKFLRFSWMTNLFIKGSKTPLEQEDLEGISPDDCSGPLTEKLER